MWRYNGGALNWLSRVGNYCLRVGDAVSQFVNVALFLCDNPNESVSARAYRQRDNPYWGTIRTILDKAFSPFEKDHCRKAHAAEVRRARALIQGVL
jgi:hypothetical protein